MNKSAIIFGGSGGIGRVVADFFVSAGYGVTIAARSREQVENAVQGLRRMAQTTIEQKGAGCASSGGAVLPRVCGQVADVTSFESVDSVIGEHEQYFDGLDVIVNAAALQGPIGPLWKNDPNKWCEAVAANLNGVFHVCRAGLGRMLKAGRGVIIMFSGGGAAYARPHFSAYGASKTGVLRLVETVYEELRSACSEEIQIYAVAPGAVRTRMTDEVLACQEAAGARAYAEAVQIDAEGGTPPEKAAKLCLYLAEQRPKCLSGRLIHVNEPYAEYVIHFEGKDPGDAGMLRRQPYKYTNK